MQNYQGIHLQIRIPQLLSNPHTITNIVHTTKKISEQVDLQLQLSLLIHSIFQDLSNDLKKECIQSETKYQSCSGTNNFVCKQLIKTIHLAFHGLHHVSFKHQIDLKTIGKRQKQKSFMDSILDRLQRIKVKTQIYSQLYKQYKQKQIIYIQMSQGFSDIYSKAIRYYSFDNNSKINKIIEMQLNLQKLLLKLQNQQSFIQLLYRQTYKFLYELLSNKVKRIYQIVGFIQQSLIKLFSIENVIVQEGSKDYITNLSQQNFEGVQAKSPQQAIDAAKKILQIDGVVRQNFKAFLTSIITILQTYEKKLNDSAMKKTINNVQRQRDIIEGTIECKIYYDGTSSSKLINIFQNFIQLIIYKFRSNNNISKYKVMQEDLFHRLQKQLKNFTNNLPNGDSIEDNQQLYNYYIQMSGYLKKKYYKQAQDINNNFKEDIINISKQFKDSLKQSSSQLLSQFSRPSQQKINALIKKILSSEYYRVFENNFVTKKINYRFIRSPQVNSYMKYKNDLQYSQPSINLSVETKSSKSTCFGNVACCGGKQKHDKQCFDEFNCALKDKILLQGKLKLYKKQIVFLSMFNKNTLFGKTLIVIPSKQIIRITKKSFNGILIETQYGNLTFVSFVSNPLPILISNYVVKQTYKSSLKQQILQESSQQIIKITQSLKDKLLDRLLELEYKIKEENTLQKVSVNLKQIVVLFQQQDGVNIKIQYIAGENVNQMYSLFVCQRNNKIHLKYSLGDNIDKNFKQPFLKLIRCISPNIQTNIHNTRSQIFQFSSISNYSKVQQSLNKKDRRIRNNTSQTLISNEISSEDSTKNKKQFNFKSINQSLTKIVSNQINNNIFYLIGIIIASLIILFI